MQPVKRPELSAGKRVIHSIPQMQDINLDRIGSIATLSMATLLKECATDVKSSDMC